MKKILSLSIILTFAILFTGCFNPVFNDIRKEVKLNDASVVGSVSHMARVSYNDKEYLFAATGVLYFSQINAGTENSDWYLCNISNFSTVKYDAINRVYSGEKILQVAADSNNVYILTEKYISEDEIQVSGRKLYQTAIAKALSKGSQTWEEISVSGKYPKVIFCTNEEGGSTEAYVTYTNGSTRNLSYNSDAGNDYFGAAKFNGSRVFHSTSAITTNKDGTVLYKSSESYGEIDYVDKNGNPGTTNLELKAKVLSLALCGNELIVGTSQGIKKIRLDANGVPTAVVHWSTNAEAAISKVYEVKCLISVNSALSDTEGCIYAGVDFTGTGGTFKNICLWSYEPSRGNWNRE